MLFYMPTKVYHERDSIKNHGEELAQLGNKAMIVTGKNSARLNGAYDDVKDVLAQYGRQYILFNETEENPSVETVMRARDVGIEEGVDFVIGIGGGSPLDAAKAIALMIRQKDKNADFLYLQGSNEALPVAAVPTTAGTGSEVTPYSILTRKDIFTKSSIVHKIFPYIAFVDSKYLLFAPERVLKNTAVDTLGHFYESYFNSNSSDYSKMLVEKGLRIWARSKMIFEDNITPSIDDCDNMLLASSIAGMAITHTGTSLPHGLSYPLTVRKGIPHGKAVGYFLPGYLRECESVECDTILKLSGFNDVDDLASFILKVNGPIESDFPLLNKDIDELLSNKKKLKNCPFYTDRDVLSRIAGIK